MRPYVKEDLCIACGACAAVCPADPVVFEIGEKAVVAHPEACTACGACEENCPTNAIQIK
ncbi:MAG: 4Fe-4S binding protein [Candidatus Brocadiia bacterium]